MLGKNGQRLTPAPEARIMRLLKKGMGLHPIARKLGIPVYRVWRTAKKNSFRRAGGNTGLADPEADVEGFIAAIKRRDDHIWNLCEKFHIGKCRGNRLAHEILQTHKFRPGASKPALSSAFPQKHFGPRLRRGSER